MPLAGCLWAFGGEPIAAALALQNGLVLAGLATLALRNMDHIDNARRARTQLADSAADLAALTNLFAISDIRREVPLPGGWAATPRTMLRLVSLAEEVPAGGLIVECGSGTSTVWLAHTVQRTGRGRVIALEHDPHYAEQTRKALERNGLSEYAEVRSAPLEPVIVGEKTCHWYAAESYSGLSGIHLLFVDGPPAAVAHESRYPAYPLLGKALSCDAVVVMDDADRPEEQSICEQWLAAPVDGARLRDEGMVSRSRLLRVQP